MIYYYLTVLIFGLVIGSFLNVVVWRVPRDESISFPPSHCPKCNEPIKPYDLIPVISFIILGGKCRHCKDKISIEYPIVELINGIMYVFIFFKFPLLQALEYSFLFSLLLSISLIDFKTQLVDDRMILFGAAVIVIFELINKGFTKALLNNIYGAVIGAAVIGLIVFLTRGMGEGDIEIFALCGFVLGFKYTLLSLWLSFILGGVIAVSLLLLKIKKRKDPIAFGPYIALGSFIALLYGDSLIRLIFKK
jgi:leader peptidase (prepilin peptidase) / N-methyltransferase